MHKQGWLTMLRKLLWPDDVITRGLVVLVVVLAVIVGTMVFGIFDRSSKEQRWQTLRKEAQKAYALENFDVAEERYREAAKVALAVWGDESAPHNDTLKRLAWVLGSKGKYAKCREIYVKLNRLSSDDVIKMKMAQLAFAAQGMNRENIDQGNYEGVLHAYKKTCLTIDKYFGPTDPSLVPLLEDITTIYVKKKKWSEAENECLRIISIMSEVEGEQSLGVARGYSQLALVYSQQGNQAEASNACDKAVGIYSALLGPNASQIAELKQRIADGPSQHKTETVPEEMPSYNQVKQ